MCNIIQKMRTLITVEPVMFLYMTGTFLLTPAYQQLILFKVCGEMYSENTEVCADLQNHQEESTAVQSKASYIMLIYMSVVSLLSVIPAIFLGSWSDRAGRKLGMCIPSIFSAVSGGLFIAIAELPEIGVYWTIVNAAIIGISGSHVAVFLSVFSYLADISDGSALTTRIGIAEAMIYFGGTVGFLLGGTLLQYYSFTHAFGVFCGCHILAVIYVICWLKESKHHQDQEKVLQGVAESILEEKHSLSLAMYAKRTFSCIVKRRAAQDRLKLYLLVLCMLLVNLANTGEQSLTLMFVTYPPRSFNNEKYGEFTATRMLLSGFSLLGVFPLLLRYVGEMILAKVSCLLRIGAFILMAFSTNIWMVFLVAVVNAAGGFAPAVIRSICSRIVGPNEQGAMFSLLASVETLCILVGGAIFNGLYPITLASFPGMSFIVMAAFIIITLILIQWVSEMPTTHPPLIINEA
ncbi:proton-coupled folate transporter-like [Protopterus annectens]|uniref:proton-coupled folate transporter-like n=1 Tax=Protopterus annectens TaxID=7888 RepID=UPI001CFBC8C8|nr:proton-coupled folate transporter-like [Protopterus annectens]